MELIIIDFSDINRSAADQKVECFLPSVASVCEARRPAKRKMWREKEGLSFERGPTLDQVMATDWPCSRLHIQSCLSPPLQRHSAGHCKTSEFCWGRQKRGNVTNETNASKCWPTACKEVRSFGNGKTYLWRIIEEPLCNTLERHLQHLTMRLVS